MKFKNTAVIFSFILLFSIFNMGFVPAQDSSVNAYQCNEGEFYDFVDGGCRANDKVGEIEPPTFFEGVANKVKFAFSDPETKVRLSAVLTAQQTAQLEQALDEGDYAKADAVSENIRQTLEKSGRYIEEYRGEEVNYEEFQNGEGEFNDFLYTKRMYIQDIEKLNEIKSEILTKVDAGETTYVAVENIFKNFGEEGRIISKFDKKENEFVDKIAEEGGVTELEIKYAINEDDKKTGITEAYYKNYNVQDYAETMAKLDVLKNEIANSDKPYSREVENLFDEARLRAQLSQTEIQNEHYSDGYNEFYKSQYIMYSLENYAEEGERALNKIDDSVAVGPVELNNEIEEENKQFIEEYSKVREIIYEKYPEEVKNLDNSYMVAQDVRALSKKMDELAEQELTKLKEDGKTEEEAQEIIEEKKVIEYSYNYGEKYFPPGYVEVSSDETTKEITYEYGGGPVKRYDYSDEANNIDYIFGDNGYSWTTWTGEKYSAPHPPDYKPDGFMRGDEKFETEIKTEDGNYNYEYYATGYKTIDLEGIETEVVYSDTADKMQGIGGAFFDYEPTGYVVTYKGKANVWYESPVFDNYINAVDGKVFVSGVQEDASYNAEEKVYETTYEEVKWAFDPETKIWTNKITKQVVPTLAPDAPIGYEEELVYTTEDKTEWNYRDAVWNWETVDGIEGEYIPAPSNYYSYNSETKEYSDVKGNSYVGSVEYGGDKWTMQGGTWVSEGGIKVYNPKTGTVYGSEDSKKYGVVYDASGTEMRSYTYNTGSYAWSPIANDYRYYSEYGLANYDPANPPTHDLTDAEGNFITTWEQKKDGRWIVKGSIEGEGYFGYEEYFTGMGGTGMQGGYAGGYYGGTYNPATQTYVGATGCSSGCYGDFGGGLNYYGGSLYNNNLGQVQQLDGTWSPAISQAEADAAKTAGTYLAPGTPAVGIYGSTTGSYSSGSYASPTGPRVGYYDSAIGSYVPAVGYFDERGNYVPPTYGASETYSGGTPSTRTSGYYSTNGAWVSTPSTNYANYYGVYSGTGAVEGTTAFYNDQTYTVTAAGWTDASGTAVAPPPGYASATGAYSSGYSSGGYYSGSGEWVSGGGYVAPTSGGYYNQEGNYVSGTAGTSYTAGYYDATSGAWVPSSGSYPTGTYPGSYASPTGPMVGYYDSATGNYVPAVGYYDSATGNYVPPTYGASETYSGGYVGGDTSGYTGGGTYDSATGTYSGGDTSTSTSTSTSTDSGGTTSSGGSTGGVISDSDNAPTGNWFRNFLRSLFR